MAFNGGDGTLSNPYIVSKKEELNDIRNYLNCHFKQSADIDISSYTNWIPIGSTTYEFKGSYDGNGFSIRGLTITTSGTSNGIGLFGVVAGSTLKNIDITGTITNPTKHYVGMLVGYAKSSGTNPNFVYNTIDNCHAHGIIRQTNGVQLNSIGGLVGFLCSKITKDCSSDVYINLGTLSDYVGGLVGNYSYGVLSNCHSSGTVYADGCIGGLVGMFYGGSVNNCYSLCNLSGDDAVGGVIGRIDSSNGISIFNKCYFNGTIEARTTYSDVDSGGFVGDLMNSTNRVLFTDCYAIGTLSKAKASGGGFTGSCYGSTSSYILFTNCYSRVTIASKQYNDCGFFPHNALMTHVSFKGCYFDSESTGCTDNHAIAKTIAQMKTQATFEEYDFENTWATNEHQNNGYPIFVIHLAVQMTNDDVNSQQEYYVHFQRARTVYAKIEILNEYDVVVDEVTAHCVDGSVNLEAENSIRRTCDLTLLLQNKYLLTEESPFWGNKRIRLYIGIKHNVTDEIIYFNLGIFVINSHDVNLSNTGKEVILKCSDKMCLLNGDTSGSLENITKISAGTPIHEAIKATITTIGGETKYIIDEVFDANGVLLTVPYDIEKDAGDTVTSILDELNNFYMNFQYYFDEDGIFRFCKRPNRSTDAIIWDFTDYDFRISSGKSSNLNNIKNRIKVWGGIQEDSSQPSSERILTNATNPNSAFTVEKWGERKFVISEDTYSTVEMCSQRAEYELLMHTLFQEQISISCLPIYMLDINKLVKFNSVEDGIIGNYLIKSLTIPLKPETEMSFQAYKMESDINI